MLLFTVVDLELCVCVCPCVVLLYHHPVCRPITVSKSVNAAETKVLKQGEKGPGMFLSGYR